MSEDDLPPVGTIGWADLTVDNAPAVRDFYSAVCGWTATEVAMGDYADYAMGPEGGDPVAGVCHARGTNAGVPAQWLLCVTVADLEASLAACTAHGGKAVTPVRDLGHWGRMAVIQDPAGAVMTILERPRAT